MTELARRIAQAILALFGGNAHLAVVVSACVPLLEIKGAIPLGQMWGLGLWTTFWLSALGLCIFGVGLLFLWQYVFAVGKKILGIRWFFVKLEQVLMSKADRERQDNGDVDKSNSRANSNQSVRKFWIIFLFAVLPLPLTGVWTSSAVAVLLKTKFFVALPATVFSTIVDGLLVLGLAYIFGDYIDTVLLIMLAIAILALVYFFIRLAKGEHSETEF